MSQLTKPTLRTFSSQAEAEDYIRQYIAEEEAKDEEQRAKLASLYPEGYSLQVRNANNVAVTRDQIAGTLEAKENVRKAYVALNEFVNKAIFHYNNNLPPLVPCDADTFYSVVINLSGNYTVLCDFQRTIIDEFGYRIADDNRIRKFVAEFVVNNIFYAAQRDMTMGNTARDHTEYNYSMARNKAHRYIGRDGSSRPWVGLNLNPQSGGVIDLFTKVDSSTCSAASTILPDDERIRFYRRCKQADRSMLPALNNVNIPDVPGYMGSRDYVPPPDRGDVISIRDSAALMAKTEKRVRPLCNARDPLAVAPPQVVPEIHVPKLSRSPVMLNQLNQLNPQIPQVQQTPQLFGNVNQSMTQQPAILNMQGTGVTINDGFNFFHGTGNTQLDQQIVRFYCDNVSQKFGYGNIISYILQNLNGAPNFCAAARAFYSNPTCMDNLVNISYNKSIDTMKAESYRYAEYAIAAYAQGGSCDADCYAAIVTSAELMFLTCLIEQAPNYLGNTTYRIYMERKYGANNSMFNGGNGVSQPFGGVTGNTVFGGPNAHPSVNNLFTGNLPGFNSATTTQSNARIVSAEQMVNAASGVSSPAQPIKSIMMPAVTPTNEAPIVPAAPVIVSAQGEPITNTQSPVLPKQTVVTQPATVAVPNQPAAVQAQPQVVESVEDDEARELKIYKTVGTPLIRDLLTNTLDTVDTNGECVPFTTITEAESRRFEIRPRKLFGNAVEYLAPRSADGTSSFGYSRDYDDFINSVFRVRTPGMPLSYILYNRVYSGMIGYAKDADSANILLLGIRGPEVTNTGKYDFGFNINDSKIRTHESSYHMWNWDLCTVPYISNIHEVSKDRLKTILLENGVPVVDVLTKIADRVVAAAFNQSGEAGSSIITHEEYQLYLSNSYASVYGSRIIQYINRVLLRAECGYGFGEWLARTHKDAETVRILNTYFGEDIVANKQPLVDEATIVESVEPAMTVQDQRDLDTNVAQAFTAAKIVDPAELVLSTVRSKTQPAPQPASVVFTPATVVPTVTASFAPTPAVAEPEPEVTTKTVCYSNPLEVPPYPETCEDPKAQRIAKQVSVLLGDKSLFDETRPLGDYLDEASAMGIDISELASAPIRDMKGYNRRIEMVRGAILGCKIRSTLPVEQYYGSVRHDLVSNETPIDFLEQQRICDEKGIKWQIPANTKCTFWYRDPMDGRATDNPPLYTPAWVNRNMAAAAKYGIIRKQLARYEQDAIRMQECFATGEEYIPSLPVSVDTGYVPSDYKYKEKYSTKFDEYGTRHVVEIATVNECVIDNIVAHPLFMSDGIRFNEYAPTRPKVRNVEPAAPAVAPVEAKPAIAVTPMPVPPVVSGDCPSCQQDSCVAETPVEVKEESHLSMLERDSLEYQRTNPEEYARLVAEAEAATDASAAEEAARMEAERKALEEDEREFYRQAIAAAEEVDMEVTEEVEEEEEYPVTKDVPYKTSANFSLIQKIADHYNLKCSDVVPDEKLGVPTMPIIYNEERGVPASHRPVYFDKDDIRDANIVEWEMCQPPVKDTELVDGEDGKEIRTNFKSFYTIDECYMAKLDNNRKMRVTSVRITDPMLDHQAAIEAIKECEPQLFKTGDDGIENSCMITYDEVKVFKGNFQAMRKLVEDVREILWDDNIDELDASGACIVCACEMIKACPDESVKEHISRIIVDRFNEAARVSLAHMVIDNDTDSKVNTYFKAESLDDIIFLSNQTFNVTGSSIWSSGVSDDFVGAFTTCTLYAFGAIWWRGFTVPVALRPKAGDRTFKPYLDSSRFNEDKFFILTSPEANIRVGHKGNISGLTIAMNMEEVKDKNRTTVKYRNLSKEQIAQLNEQLANVCALRVEHHVFVHTLDDIPAKVTSDQTEYVNKFSAVQFLYNLYKKFSVYASVNMHYYGEHVVKPVIVGIDVDRNVAAYQGAPQLSR